MSEIKGVIYIITNPAFPDYVKIGYADDLERRLKQFNRSECVPFAFRAYAVYEVNKRLQDKQLHALIDQLNPDLRAIEEFDGAERVKEFYMMTAQEAYSLLECIATLSGTLDRLHRLTPEGHEIIDEQIAEAVQASAKERKSPFSFVKSGIPMGATIVFASDENITATVIADRRIEYKGVSCSLSGLSQELLGASSIQGPRHWKYEGKLLVDIRKEREEQGLYR